MPAFCMIILVLIHLMFWHTMPHELSVDITPLISALTQWTVTQKCLAQAPLGWHSL